MKRNKCEKMCRNERTNETNKKEKQNKKRTQARKAINKLCCE